MRVRHVRISWESFGPHRDALAEIADNLTLGVHHRSQSENSDERFLERVAEDTRQEFLRHAGESTGADGFSFTATIAE